MKVTPFERRMLEAIRDSEYQDGDFSVAGDFDPSGCDPVGRHVWVFSVTDGFGASAGGVMASLSKKGLVHGYEYEPGQPVVALTEAGFEVVGPKED